MRIDTILYGRTLSSIRRFDIEQPMEQEGIETDFVTYKKGKWRAIIILSLIFMISFYSLSPTVAGLFFSPWVYWPMVVAAFVFTVFIAMEVKYTQADFDPLEEKYQNMLPELTKHDKIHGYLEQTIKMGRPLYNFEYFALKDYFQSSKESAQ